MKRLFLLGGAFCSCLFYTQNNLDELNKEIGLIKTKIHTMQTDIQAVKSENIHLKNILKINKPILEIIKDNTKFTTTKVEGNKQEKNIYITLLVEAQDGNKEASLDNISIFDLEGNEIGINFYQSDDILGHKLALNVPKKIKLVFNYKEIENDFPKIIKLFRFRFTYINEKDEHEIHGIRKNLEFRDLNIIWK